jgi:lipopolysaccharide transport system permease protein
LNTHGKTQLPPHDQVFDWAWQAVQEKNWQAAAQRWEVLRQSYPKHSATWLQGAHACIEAGDFEHAGYLLTHAQQEFPDNPHTLTESALLATRQKEWDIAESYLQEARQKHPDNPQTWLKSSEYAEEIGELEQATAYSEKACQCNPEQPGPYLLYAELAMRNKQWAQALQRWQDFRSRFPEMHAGYFRAAEALRKLGRPKEARQLILAQQYGASILDSSVKEDVSTKDKTLQTDTDNTQQYSDQSGGDTTSKETASHKQPAHSHTNITQLLDLIWTKAVFNLRAEDHHNYLSYLWWVLEPIIHMAIYYLVFGYLLQRGGENYPVFLLTGLIPWMWFMKAVTSSSNSIVAGQHLMLQVGLPSIVFPLVSLIQATLKQVPVYILLFVFLWSQGITPDSNWWALIPVIVVQTLFTIAFACMVAATIPFMRDLSYLVPTGLTLLMFLSGIFYDYSMIPAEWQSAFLMNPIAFLLHSYREVLIDNALPDMQVLTLWGLGSAAACVGLMVIYNRLRYVYPRVLME